MRTDGSCSTLSRSLGEPLVATAPRASAWLLVEQPGPWGAKALVESRLHPEVGAELERRTVELGVKALLVKRPDRDGTSREARRAFLVWAGRGSAFVEEAEVGSEEELLSLDLAALSRGARPGAGPERQEPLYLVCTNGKRDACCARIGRLVARELARLRPEAAWESSHLGGHRFAANVVALPEGLCYGRVDEASATSLVEAHERGRVLAPLLRGRSSLPEAAQAAEAFVRERHGLDGIDDVAVEECAGADVTVRLAGGCRLAVTVEQRAGVTRPASCGEKPEASVCWHLIALAPV